MMRKPIKMSLMESAQAESVTEMSTKIIAAVNDILATHGPDPERHVVIGAAFGLSMNYFTEAIHPDVARMAFRIVIAKDEGFLDAPDGHE